MHLKKGRMRRPRIGFGRRIDFPPSICVHGQTIGRISFFCSAPCLILPPKEDVFAIRGGIRTVAYNSSHKGLLPIAPQARETFTVAAEELAGDGGS